MLVPKLPKMPVATAAIAAALSRRIILHWVRCLPSCMNEPGAQRAACFAL
jgi:hypothetical protein